VVEDLSAWFTYVLASYKLNHALDERGELDAEKLEEAAEEFEKAAEMRRKLRTGETTSPPAVGLLGPASSPQRAGRSFSRELRASGSCGGRRRNTLN
jgi:hypothetical protein